MRRGITVLTVVAEKTTTWDCSGGSYNGWDEAIAQVTVSGRAELLACQRWPINRMALPRSVVPQAHATLPQRLTREPVRRTAARRTTSALPTAPRTW